MLTVALNTTIFTPSEPAKDLSGLREDVDGDEGVEGDELDQDGNIPEEFGDEEDEFLKLNLPDSYRIFFEYLEDQDEDESEDDQDGHDDGEDQEEDEPEDDQDGHDDGENQDGDEFEDDFHLPEAYKIFFT